MSNSFPTMISNEPPPLDQSDDDDEDSEEFRDFSSGLKFDIDPSPMSTPRKSKLDQNLPIPNGGSSDSTVDSSPKNEFDGGNNHVCISEPASNNLMKTSYIGTLETEIDVEQEQVVQTLHSPEKIIENHVSNCSHPSSPTKRCETPVSASQAQCASPSNFHSLTDHDDDDDFDEFQDFQTNVTTMDKVKSEDEREDSQSSSQNDKSGNDESSEQRQKEGEVEQLSADHSQSSLSFPEDDQGSPTVIIPPSHDELNNFEDATTNFDFETQLDSPNKIFIEESEYVQTDSNPPPTSITEADNSFNENFSAFQGVDDVDDDDEFDNFQEFQAPQSASHEEDIVNSGKVDCVQSSLSMNSSSSAPQDMAANDSTNINLEMAVLSLDIQHEEQATTDIQHSNSSNNNNHKECQEETPSSNFQSFQDDDEDDDFEEFQAFEPVQEPISQATNSVSAPLPVSNNANFHNNNAPTVTTVMFPPPSQMNFEDVSTSGGPARKSLLMENKFENILKSLFVITPGSGSDDELCSSLKPIDKELKEDNDNEEWSRVEDFEGSQGLLFKWLNSVAYEKLLHSLKIDKSSIVYTNKWGPIEVPRFAASLVDNSPLLPESSGTTTATSKQQGDVVHKINNSVKSDSIKSPSSENDCSRGQGSTGQLSQEAEQILSQLPDLSFMRANGF